MYLLTHKFLPRHHIYIPVYPRNRRARSHHATTKQGEEIYNCARSRRTFIYRSDCDASMSLLDMRMAVLEEGGMISLVAWVGGNELDTLLDVLGGRS